jgi:DNA-binding transcriptional regulator YiaG
MWTAQKIKTLRKRGFNMTQEEFSRLLGITKFGLRMWEQDQSKPSEMAEILLGRLEDDLQNGRIEPKPQKQPA